MVENGGNIQQLILSVLGYINSSNSCFRLTQFSRDACSLLMTRMSFSPNCRSAELA